MGYELAQRAFLWSRLLTPRETLTLVYMATCAHDQDERPMYFGGRDRLALATLGRLLTPESPTYRSDQEVIRRAVAGLVRAGAITRAREATNAARATYELMLDRLPLPGLGLDRDREPVDNVVDIRHRLRGQPQQNVGPEPQQNVGAISRRTKEEDRGR